MASLIRVAMSLLDVPGGNRSVPGLGSSKICCAQMAALPMTWSTLGGRLLATTELYVGWLGVELDMGVANWEERWLMHSCVVSSDGISS